MRLSLVLALATVLGSAGIAHANTVNTFNLSAVLADGSASGTVTLDQTTGKFIDSNVTLVVSVGTGGFSGAPLSSTSGSNYTSSIFSIASSPYTFNLLLPIASLQNYTGGSLCTMSALCSSTESGAEYMGTDVDPVMSGSLTLAPAVAVTPEPSSLLLLGTGVLVIGTLLKRRRV